MILYQGTAKEFSDAVETNTIIPQLETIFRKKLGRDLPPAERGAYTNSLSYMERVVRRSNIASDCGILIEYIIPLTANRIDFLIAGEDEEGNKNCVLVELKQWEAAERTDLDGVVRTYLGKGIQDTAHPSYQVHSYKEFLSDFNENIDSGLLHTYACAYLHNYTKKNPEPLLHDAYTEIVNQAPLYFRSDQEKLESFISKYVKNGKGTNILYQLDSGKIKPAKKLIDHVSQLYAGNDAYILLDDQKVAFERARSVVKNTTTKSVVIVNGGPGTGKSVLSINLLGQFIKDGLNTMFIAPNASFRDVVVSRLSREHSAARIKNLFKGSAGFVDTEPNTFDVMVVDEAHRLKEKGAFMYRGSNQLEDIVKSATTSIFLIDDDQAIRLEDVGSVSEIKRVAALYDVSIYEVELSAQFRCSGAEGYVNWLNSVLHIKETGNYDGWDKEQFDFKIFNDPNKLREAIKTKHDEGFIARMLAGFAWKWTDSESGNPNAEIEDVEIPEFDFRMPWNSRRVSSTWAINLDGINQVGCIHTSQGLEFDYVGVIVGNDLKLDPEKLEYYTDHVEYKDSQGKRGLKDNPRLLNLFVRRIYKILMSRGMKGCYVYIMDKNVEQFFKNRMKTT